MLDAGTGRRSSSSAGDGAADAPVDAWSSSPGRSTWLVGLLPDGTRPPDIEIPTLVDRLAAAVRDQDRLDGLDADGLRARVADLRRLAGLADAGLAAAVAALDACGGVQADGAPSAAEWIKTATNRSGRDAARTARLADGLGRVPATAAALADGDLTAEAADAIVRATEDPRMGDAAQVEADLLPVATTTSPERLRRHIAAKRHAANAAAMARDERRQRALRDGSLTRRHDGMWDLHARLPDEAGTRLRTALDALDVPTPETARRPGHRFADALDAMAATVLDHGLAPATGGVARPHLTVTVDLATLAADLTRPDVDDVDAPDAAIDVSHARWADLAPGATDWDGLISPQSVRRIACDATLTRVVLDAEGQPLDVGRATRTWSGAQRRAVNVRDRGCRGPSCDRPIGWTQIHHVHWWRHDGVTAVSNGIALCHHCHHLVHDRGWTVALDPADATATWTGPDGCVVVSEPHPSTIDRRRR